MGTSDLCSVDTKKIFNSASQHVSLEPGARVEPSELRARLKSEISAYKVPRHLFVDDEDALPFTDTGKIDKKALGQLLAERIASGV